MQNNNLDNFITSVGEELNENYNLVNKEKIQNAINNTFLYDDNSPVPGQPIDNKLDEQLNSINETTALDSLITKAALVKAKNESKRKKLTMKERNQFKKQFIESMMYQHGEAYYQKNKCMMDGKTKRKTRRHLETEFDKGKYDKYLLNNTNLNE